MLNILYFFFKYGASKERADSECDDSKQDMLHLSPDAFSISDNEEEYSKLRKKSGKKEVEIALSVQEEKTGTLPENDKEQYEGVLKSFDIEKAAFTNGNMHYSYNYSPLYDYPHLQPLSRLTTNYNYSSPFQSVISYCLYC